MTKESPYKLPPVPTAATSIRGIGNATKKPKKVLLRFISGVIISGYGLWWLKGKLTPDFSNLLRSGRDPWETLGFEFDYWMVNNLGISGGELAPRYWLFGWVAWTVFIFGLIWVVKITTFPPYDMRYPKKWIQDVAKLSIIPGIVIFILIYFILKF